MCTSLAPVARLFSPASQGERTHFHWANRPGCLAKIPVHHRLNRLY